jgi:hypothetical protein
MRQFLRDLLLIVFVIAMFGLPIWAVWSALG